MPKGAADYRFTCEHCGAVIEPISSRWEHSDRVFYFRSQCDCEAAEAERAEAKRVEGEERRNKKFNELIEGAGNIHIGRYAKMTFDNWDTTRHQKAQKHLSDVVEFCDTHNKERNLLWLWGEYGTGKTHLALAALRKLVMDTVIENDKIELGGIHNTPHFTEWIIHCSRVQQSWDSDSNENEGRLWLRMNKAAFLAIDDIDKRVPSEWAMGKLYEVLHYRYMHEKLTIITANHSLAQLDDIWTRRGGYVADIGSAIISRITGQLWAEVEITGGDQRAR